MMQSLEEVTNAGKDIMDSGLKSFASVSKSAQAMVVEATEFSRKSFEETSAATEKLLAVRSLDKAFEVQADYARSAYESLISESTRFNELFADMAKQAFQPFELAAARR